MNDTARATPAATAPAPLIALSGISRTFVTGDMPVTVLKDVSLEIRAGEFVAIMGQSGSGKSTLMNILGCLDKPSAGTYRFAGHDVSDLSTNELAALRREAFGFVFQGYHLIAGATAVENVEVPAIYAGLPAGEREERAEALLTRLGLGERLDHRPNQLSGGQQQRVSIARALMNGGHVILADEPTGALDSRSGTEVIALLKKLAEDGHTVILITHDREVAANARRRIEIRDGRIISDSGPDAAALARAAPTPDVTVRPRPVGAVLSAFGEAAVMAIRSLKANLFRTFLTLLGIVIGVASVVGLLAIGQGATSDVLSRISAMGDNLLVIRPGAPNQRVAAGSSVLTLVNTDAAAIDRLDNVLAALPEVASNVTVRSGNVDYTTSVQGTSWKMPVARNWDVARGTFFSEADQKAYAPVTVIGQTVADILFPDGADPIGKWILVKSIPFQVVGVLASKGATFGGQDQDDAMFVPITTGLLRLFGNRGALRSVTVAVDDTSRIAETQMAITDLLAGRHGKEDFQIRNMASIIETATQTAQTMTLMLGSIAAISLLVGGIGVMNIMLVSVTERTKEIGVRMATGARTWDILQQFLTEAIVVSAIGGVIGVGLGVGVGWIAGQFGMQVVFSTGPMLLAFGCATATGLVFGFAPAYKAAHLDPVVALSSE